jgi:putative transposase
VRTIKEECLDHFIVFGEDHLRHICNEYVDYYEHQRPHRGTDFHPLDWNDDEAEEVVTTKLEDLVRKEKLGGRLTWYERKVA